MGESHVKLYSLRVYLFQGVGLFGKLPDVTTVLSYVNKIIGNLKGKSALPISNNTISPSFKEFVLIRQ